MSAAASSPVRTAPLVLWRAAEAFLRVLHALFGAPEDVAGAHVLSGARHTLIASWLRCAEAMLRRLILIEAAACPHEAPHPPRPPRQHARKLMHFYADQPEAWRVSFRMCAAPRRARQRAASRAKADASRSAWPLAERYEALIRAFNDPAAYAARTARRLRRDPQQLARALRAPPEAAERVAAFATLTRRAEHVWRRRFSSA